MNEGCGHGRSRLLVMEKNIERKGRVSRTWDSSMAVWSSPFSIMYYGGVDWYGLSQRDCDPILLFLN